MVSLPVHWIEARTYCHATEEVSRVARALETACPGGTVRREAYEGQHGNPILLLEHRLEDGEEMRQVWERWRDAGVLEALRSDVSARVDDEGILHFRLDKQRAFEGKLALVREGDAIDVRVRLKAFPAKPDAFQRIALAFVEGP